MNRSKQLHAAACRVIPGGVNSPVRAFRNVGGEPFYVESACGCRIRDVDGREMVDYVGTWGPAILGHAPEAVVEAVRAAAGNGLSFGIPNPFEVEMAETVCRWVPSVEKVRMTNSGTEATMSALRLARGFTGRSRVVKFEGCYHGHGDSLLVAAGSGALTHGRPDSAGVPEALAALTSVLPFNDFEAASALFRERGEEIAAVIVEPVPANAGLIPPLPGFLEHLRKLTCGHGALLIFDEVMTGFRVARGGVQELTGIVPDLSCFGKVIGGGLPVGAFGGRAEIMDHLAPLGPVYQAGTLSGNPLAMVAGLTQLRELERLDAFKHLEKLGQHLETGVRAMLAALGKNYVFHRLGSMFCLFLTEEPVVDLPTAMKGDKELFSRFFHACLQARVYLAPSPYETGFLCTAHDEASIDFTVGIMHQSLRRALG